MLSGRKRARSSEELLVQIYSSEKPFVSELCRTQDISPVGARLITERPWAPDSRVLVNSPDGDLWARVVYCQLLSRKTFGLSRKEFAVGLEFLQTSEWAKWA